MKSIVIHDTKRNQQTTLLKNLIILLLKIWNVQSLDKIKMTEKLTKIIPWVFLFMLLKLICAFLSHINSIEKKQEYGNTV